MASIDFKRLMWDKSLKQNDIADIMGVNQSVVSKFIRGQRTPLKHHIDKLVAHFGDNVIKYYQSSDNDNLPIEKKFEDSSDADVIEDDTTQSMAIPMVTDVVLSQRGVDIKHYIEKNGSELQSIDPYTLFEGAEFIVEMFKDSMAPDIMAGDKVILQFLPKDAKLQSGALYFVNSRTYADVVRDVYLEGDKAILKARNKRYGDIVLDKSEIIRVANVLGIYRNTFSSSYAQLDELRERKDAQMNKMLDMMKTQAEQQGKLINYITKTK